MYTTIIFSILFLLIFLYLVFKLYLIINKFNKKIKNPEKIVPEIEKSVCKYCVETYDETTQSCVQTNCTAEEFICNCV